MLRNRKWVAVDFDRRELRLVVYDLVRKAPAIQAMHTIAIGAGVDATDAAALGAFLKGVVDKLGLGGAHAVMCVGRGHAVLKSLMLPGRPPPAELPAMVQYQVSKELPFSAEEAVVDYTRGAHWDTDQQELAEGTTVLAAAVRLPVVAAAQEICTAAGLRLERLGLRPYANLRAVRRCAQPAAGKRLLLVNVTSNEAEIDVIRDDMLEFSRAATLLMPGEGPDEPDGPRQHKQGVGRVVAEVTRSLQSFHAVQPGARLDGCVLAGNTGMERDLAAALAKDLGVRCELLDVARGFAVSRDEAASAFAAALGLATGGAGEEMPFDFLNPKRPAPPVDTRRRNVLAVVAAAAVLLAGTMLAAKVHLNGRDRVLNDLRKIKRTREETNKGLKKLDDRVRNVKNWLNDDIDWLDQVAELSRSLPEAKDIYVDSLRCSPAPPKSGRRKKQRLGRIVLSGRVRDGGIVPQFERKLREPGYTINHKGTGPIRDKFGYGVKFNLDVMVPIRRPRTRPAPKQPAAAKVAKAGR